MRVDPGFMKAAIEHFSGKPIAESAADLFWDRCEGPIRFGVNDCCIVVADVVLAAGGPDLMAVYRGRYRSARGFVRAFRREGHKTLREACEAAFSANGRRVQQPKEFDVAVVEHFDLTEQKTVASPAILIGGFWMARTDRGGAAFDAPELDGPVYRII